jgi:hypothetical protein
MHEGRNNFKIVSLVVITTNVWRFDDWSSIQQSEGKFVNQTNIYLQNPTTDHLESIDSNKINTLI